MDTDLNHYSTMLHARAERLRGQAEIVRQESDLLRDLNTPAYLSSCSGRDRILKQVQVLEQAVRGLVVFRDELVACMETNF